jgi:P2 family phage contractile tail tube protein
MNTIYVMEAVNLFCGDHDPTASKHLTISELKLPPLQGIYADHHGGGARVAIEVEVGIQKLEPTFKLAGFDPAMLAQFGLGSRYKNVYTAYGMIRDKRTGRAIEAKAIIEARLGKIEPDAFTRGEMVGHEYALNEVTHYEMWFDGKPKIKWDFFENTWEVDGNDENADENRILRVPATGA